MAAPPPRNKPSTSQKRSHHSSSSKNSSKKSKSKPPPPKKSRKRISSESSSSAGSEGGSDEEDGVAPPASMKSSSREHRGNTRQLTDTDIWKASEFLSNNHWRALGRNLGLDESFITHIDQSYKNLGTRECVYNVLLEWKSQKSKRCTLGALYKSLEDSKMYDAAKAVAKVKYGS